MFEILYIQYLCGFMHPTGHLEFSSVRINTFRTSENIIPELTTLGEKFNV